jgi:hypothetical protein
MIHLLIGILIIALVWVLTGALGLPYIVSVIVTVLAALYVLGPGLGLLGSGRRSIPKPPGGGSGQRIQGAILITEAKRVPRAAESP